MTRNLSFLKFHTNILDDLLNSLEGSKDYYFGYENYYFLEKEQGNITAHYSVFTLKLFLHALTLLNISFQFHNNRFCLIVDELQISICLNLKKKCMMIHYFLCFTLLYLRIQLSILLHLKRFSHLHQVKRAHRLNSDFIFIPFTCKYFLYFHVNYPFLNFDSMLRSELHFELNF